MSKSHIIPVEHCITNALVELAKRYKEKLGITGPFGFTVETEPDHRVGFISHLSYPIRPPFDLLWTLTALHFVLDRDEYGITLEEWAEDREIDPHAIGCNIDEALGLVPLHKEAEVWVDMLLYFCGSRDNDLFDFDFEQENHLLITIDEEGLSIADNFSGSDESLPD